MVVGHQHRYKNSRIVTIPSELDCEFESRRVPEDCCLYSGVDLTWFLLEIEGADIVKDGQRLKVGGFSHDTDNNIRTKLDDSDYVSTLIGIQNQTRNNSDVRKHEGTPILNIPHRLTPEYTVTAGNDMFSVETKKQMDHFRELDEEALIGPKDDIIFVSDRFITKSSQGRREPIYLLLDWESLCKLSANYFELAFAELRDGEYITDATTGSNETGRYIDAVSRVLDYI